MDNIKNYTVSDFCEKYNSIESNEDKNNLIESVVCKKYVPYEMKVTICKNIVKSTYYKTVDRNGLKISKLHVDSPTKYMLFSLEIVKNYTIIEVDYSNILEEFNILNKNNIINCITEWIPERELKEFKMILDMIGNDIMCNEYEPHAFISNQVERFGELLGVISTPFIEQIENYLKDIDQDAINGLINQLMKK